MLRVPAVRASTDLDYQTRIIRVRRHLEANLDAPIAPESLARIAAFSLHHFHRIFRGLTGESILAHVRRLRLERAARSLRTTDRAILPIAFEAGYESHEAFTRAFSAHFAMAPSTFRATPSATVTAFVRDDPGPLPAVEIRTFPPLRVACLRHDGSYASVGDTFERLVTWAQRRGVFGPGARLYGACPDDPDVTETARLRFDACLAVEDSVAPEGLVGVMTIPGGTYAVALHRGPFERLSETYLALIGRWLPTTQHELADEAVIEAYLDDKTVTPPEELRTEVRVRLAPRD